MRRSRCRSTARPCSTRSTARSSSPAGAKGELLNCGPIVEGPYCPTDNFAEHATTRPAPRSSLTDAGWAKNGDGYWAKDGAAAPEIRWMVNAGNSPS